MIKRLVMSLSTMPFFWMGLVMVLILLFYNDLLILLVNNGNTYALINAPGTIFEETYLYGPYISNFDFFHLLKTDYSGNIQYKGLAPLPYFSIVVLGLIGKLTANLSVATTLLHFLSIPVYILGYKLVKYYIKNDVIASAISLFLLVSGNFLMGNITMFAKNFVFLLPFLLITLLVPWGRLSRSGLWLGILVTVGAGIGYFFGLRTIFELGTYYADTNIRFIAPLLPLLIYYITILQLIVTSQSLESGRDSSRHVLLLCLLVVINVYTYYLNAFLLLVPLLLLLLYYKGVILTKRKTYLIGLLGLALLSPYVYTIYQSAHDPSLLGLQSRAANVIQGSDTANYPFRDNIFTVVYLFYVLIPVSIFAYGRKKISRSYPIAAMVGMYATGCFVFIANYLFANSIPQPILVLRYFLPNMMLLLSVLYAANVFDGPFAMAKKSFWFGRLSFLLFIAISMHTILTGIGKYNVFVDFTQPANRAVYRGVDALRGVIPTGSTLVSNHQAYNLLAPAALGLKTFTPVGLTTVGTNNELFEQHMIQSKILGYSEQDMFDYILGTGRFVRMSNFLIINNNYVNTGYSDKYISSPNHDSFLEYIQTNKTLLSQMYANLTVEDIFAAYTGIYLYLVDEPLRVELQQFMKPFARIGSGTLYRQ